MKIKSIENIIEWRLKTAIHILCDFMHERNPNQDTVDIKHITIYEYQQRLGHKLKSVGEEPKSKQDLHLIKSQRSYK